MQAGDLRYLAGLHFVAVVQADDGLMDLRKSGDRRSQGAPQFTPFEYRGGQLARIPGKEAEQVAFLGIGKFVRLQPSEVQPGNMHLPLAIAIEWNAEFGGNLWLRGRPMDPLFQSGDGRVDLPRAPALRAGRPIQTAKAVQYPSSDLVLRIGSQVDVARRVKAVDRRDQAHDTGGYQVVQVYALGQAAVNSARQRVDLRQMLEYQALALIFGQSLGVAWIVQDDSLTS